MNQQATNYRSRFLDKISSRSSVFFALGLLWHGVFIALMWSGIEAKNPHASAYLVVATVMVFSSSLFGTLDPWATRLVGRCLPISITLALSILYVAAFSYFGWYGCASLILCSFTLDFFIFEGHLLRKLTSL